LIVTPLERLIVSSLETPPQVISVRPVLLHSPARGTDLQVRITAPTAGTDLPVILFAHGFGQSMTAADPLVDHWVANGFVVVQPTFLDSATLGLMPSDPRYPTIWRTRVDDLERVIDELATIIAAVPGLPGRVDTNSLAVAGHSWGGQSVGMLLGARVLGADGQPGEDRTDNRVKAGVLLSTTGIVRGDLAPFAQDNFAFMSPDFTQLSTPTIVVAGDRDQSALSTRGPDWSPTFTTTALGRVISSPFTAASTPSAASRTTCQLSQPTKAQSASSSSAAPQRLSFRPPSASTRPPGAIWKPPHPNPSGTSTRSNRHQRQQHHGKAVSS